LKAVALAQRGSHADPVPIADDLQLEVRTARRVSLAKAQRTFSVVPDDE
jgi:hypothetical protein